MENPMNQLDEARKWLVLGYETYGPEGARAMARAVGLPSALGEHATMGNDVTLTATDSSDTLQADDQSQSPVHRGRPKPAPRRAPKPPAQCSQRPPRGVQGWRSYTETGNPDWFHCGYEGYLEDREPRPEHPVAECFYDEHGRLVDERHPYAGCKGTPDSYPATDVWGHAVNDPGGILSNGIPAAWESFRHARDQANRRVHDAMKRKGYPPFSIGPFRAPLPR
jgi:hypothetical protein